MKKKDFKFLALAFAFCMTLVFAKPVMAAEGCSVENCAEECTGECTGEECTATCCPVVVKASDGTTKCYTTLDAAINGAQSGATITLRADVEVTSQVKIDSAKSNITLDLGNYSIKASDSSMGDENSNHLLEIEASNVTVKNGSLVTGNLTKHGINVYGVNDVTLENLKIDHTKSKGGAPLVVNGSTVTVKGKLDLVLGTHSWYGINVDPKAQDKATLTLEDKSIVAAEGNGDKPVIYQDPIKEEDKGTKISDVNVNGNTEVAIKDEEGTTYYVGLTPDEVENKVKEGSTLTIMKGDMALENLPDGVTVKTEGDATATVNGYEVTDQGVDTSLLNKLKELEESLNESVSEDEKDATPKTGTVDYSIYVVAAIAVVLIGGAFTAKKLVK